MVAVKNDTTVLPEVDPLLLHHFGGSSLEAMMTEWADRIAAIL